MPVTGMVGVEECSTAEPIASQEEGTFRMTDCVQREVATQTLDQARAPLFQEVGERLRLRTGTWIGRPAKEFIEVGDKTE